MRSFYLTVVLVFVLVNPGKAQLTKSFTIAHKKKSIVTVDDSLIVVQQKPGNKEQRLRYNKDFYGSPDVIQTKDYNFDGYNDLAVGSYDGTVNGYYRVFLYQPKNNRFNELKTGVSPPHPPSCHPFTNIKINEKKKTLYCNCRFSAAGYLYDAFKYRKDGSLYLYKTLKHLQLKDFENTSSNNPYVLFVEYTYNEQGKQISSYGKHDFGYGSSDDTAYVAVKMPKTFLYDAPDRSARTAHFVTKGDTLPVLDAKAPHWVKVKYHSPHKGDEKKWINTSENNPLSDLNLIHSYKPSSSTITIKNSLIGDSLFTLSLTNNGTTTLDLRDAQVDLLFMNLHTNQAYVNHFINSFYHLKHIKLKPDSSIKLFHDPVKYQSELKHYYVANGSSVPTLFPKGISGAYIMASAFIKNDYAQPVYSKPDTIEIPQNNNPGKTLSDSILQRSQKICSSDYNTKYDSLLQWNNDLQKRILAYAKMEPDFLQRDYPAWKKNDIYMVTSPDKKFRIVFWNQQTGGTLRNYKAVYIWKDESRNDVDGKPLAGMPNSSFSSIKDYEQKDGTTFYLVRGMSHGSNRFKEDELRAYSIKNDTLDEQVNAFKTPAKELHEIHFLIDLSTAINNNDLMHFSEDEKTLYVPVVDKKGKVNHGHYLIYTYNGDQFVFQRHN